MNKVAEAVGAPSARLRPSSPLQVAVAGATGYAGRELVRLLVRHPAITVRTVCSGTGATPRAMPELTGIWTGEVTPLADADLAGAHDVVFLALPDEAAATLTPGLLAQGVRVIDLSGAHRLRDDDLRSRWYPHAERSAANRAVYGLPEHHGRELRDAQLIASAGCYPTVSLLALKPLIQASLLSGDVIIDAKSGVSGAGRTPSERTHFSECHGNVAAYGVFTHRHTAEIEQELGREVTFVPHLVPLDRGILATIHARLRPGVDEGAVAQAFHAAYSQSPFIRLTGSALPEIKHVAHSNFCDIGWRIDPMSGRIAIVSCIDNLVKGAAGQAIQNMNLACGFDERAGLWP